jgi:stearoyl-CoA desaturase (delta-9 desaturase)
VSWRDYNWIQLPVFLLMHVGCCAVLFVGWSPYAVATGAVLYLLQTFGVTAFYHRYFAHRAFRTSRAVQLIGAVLGNASMQRSPLWWAACHRRHHRHSDEAGDLHSPSVQGFVHSHMLWFMVRKNFDRDEIPEFDKYAELRFLDRHPFFVPISLAIGIAAAGVALHSWRPELGVTGPQMLIVGFLIPTILMNHVTYCVNSLGHLVGARRFKTSDRSRNNGLLAVFTFGEGWHNNHHRYPSSARQGFYWWQVDATYYLLCLLSLLRIVRDLKPVPADVLAEGRGGPAS